jgi:hypothetical protein
MADYIGWDWRLRTAAITDLLFIPRVNVSGEQWWLWCQLGITPHSSTRAVWLSYQQRHLEQVGVIDEGMRILPISIWNTSRYILHALKSYDMGPSRFTSHPKEGVLQIFIVLKNHRLGRVWIREPWDQWQAHWLLHHRGDLYIPNTWYDTAS